VTDALKLADVYRARAAIAPWVRRTPLVRSDALSRQLGRSVHLKLETLQETGSFKLRGATNRMLALSEAERERGVVAVSTGNHAGAVAHAAKRLSVSAAVFMSTLVPQNKVEAVRALGAEVRIAGLGQDAAEADARRLAKEQGRVFVSPFEAPRSSPGRGRSASSCSRTCPASTPHSCRCPAAG
jgi:threonine dehydratase